MNITEDFLKRSNGLIKQVPEYRDEGLGYTAFNDGSIECEVGEFLYGIVRVTKPRRVLETGTYKGVSSSYIAQGMKDNQLGLLDTFEIEEQHINTSKQLWEILELLPWIKAHHEPAQNYNPTINHEIIFLDSEPNLRFNELVKFFPNLSHGGFAFIHDLPPTLTQGNINPDHPEIPSWPFGNLPQEIKNWVKDGELRVIHFPNPRGMVGFYKPRLDEYKWNL